MSDVSSHVEAGVALADRRAYTRQLVQSLAYVELGDGNGGVVLNVSEGGMAVQAMMSIFDDELPCVRLQLSHSKQGFEAKARIVWSDDHRKLVGLKFIGLPEEACSQIREWALLESGGPSTLTVSPVEKNDRNGLKNSASEAEILNPHPFSTENRVLPDENPPQVSFTRFPHALKGSLPAPTEMAHFSVSPNRDNGTRKRWSILLGLVVIVALLSAGFYELRGRRAASSLNGGAALNDTRLGLKLDWTGTVWRVSWDPNAPILRKATAAQLLVVDGSLQKSVELQASDLRAGTIIYSPINNDVVWKLQVSDTNSPGVPGRLISESVRTISGRASTGNAPNGKIEQSDTNSPANGVTDSIPDETPTASGAASVSDDVQVIVTKSSQAAHEKRIFRAAKLVFGRKPSYPATARQEGVAGSVELHFKIGSDGRVHDLLAVKGPPVLAEAAMEAVGSRKYKPAVVNGVASETEATAVFDFKLN